MKVLDRYLTRELVTPILFCSMMLVFLILIADLFDNLDDILRNQSGIKYVFQYYMAIIPYAFVTTIPWAAWLGTLFLLVQLGFHNETTAMKAAGLKIISIVRPVLFIGFLIGIATFLVGDRAVPKSFKVAREIKDTYIDKNRMKEKDKTAKSVTYFSGGNQLFYFHTFSKSRGELNGVVALWLGDKPTDNRQKMIARRGMWKDPVWEFENVTEYLMDSRGRVLGEPRTFPKKTYEDIKFTPSELASASTESLYLNYKELKQSIEKLRENGVNVRTEVVDLHYRLASPWQALIMMLLTVPFLGRTLNRRAIALQVLLCVGTVFAFHVAGALGLALGKAGKILPFLSAWAGNIVFAIGALLNIDKANY